MEESAYSSLQTEHTSRRFLPPRRTLIVAGTALFVGILLTVIVVFIYLMFTGSRNLPTDVTCNTQILSLSMKCQSSTSHSKTTFTIFTDERKNWYEAMASCHEKGMLFAAINSEEEYQEVLRLIDEKRAEDDGQEDDGEEGEDFWLSGADLGHAGTYVWVSTGRAVTYSRWYRDDFIREPTNGLFCDEGPERCVELMHAYHYEMNDHCCERRKSYVCMSVECAA